MSTEKQPLSMPKDWLEGLKENFTQITRKSARPGDLIVFDATIIRRVRGPDHNSREKHIIKIHEIIHAAIILDKNIIIQKKNANTLEYYLSNTEEESSRQKKLNSKSFHRKIFKS